jgi:hypothetical protein
MGLHPGGRRLHHAVLIGEHHQNRRSRLASVCLLRSYWWTLLGPYWDLTGTLLGHTLFTLPITPSVIKVLQYNWPGLCPDWQTSAAADFLVQDAVQPPSTIRLAPFI